MVHVRTLKATCNTCLTSTGLFPPLEISSRARYLDIFFHAVEVLSLYIFFDFQPELLERAKVLFVYPNVKYLGNESVGKGGYRNLLIGIRYLHALFVDSLHLGPK